MLTQISMVSHATPGSSECRSFCFVSAIGIAKKESDFVNMYMDTDIYRTCNLGEWQEMSRLLNERPNAVFSQKTPAGDTVLHLLAQHGHVELIRRLLFAQEQHMRVIERMCRATNAEGNTPLHVAALKGHAAAIAQLLTGRNSKALAKTRNCFLETALFLACESGNLEAVKALEKPSGADCFCNTRVDGQTCFHVAAFKGRVEVLNRICGWIQSNDKNRKLKTMKTKDGSSALHSAVEGNKETSVRILIQQFPELCYETEFQGRAAIHIAAIKGFTDIVKLFLDLKPDCIDMRCHKRKTVLQYAAENNHLSVVQESIPFFHGDERDNRGNTVLHAAARYDADTQILAELLQMERLNADARNNMGETALDLLPAENESWASLVLNMYQSSATASASTNVMQMRPSARIPSLTSQLEAAGAGARGPGRSHRLLRENGATHAVPPARFAWEVEQRERQRKMLDTSTLVASLVATVAFSAMLQPPGGIDDENGLAQKASNGLFRWFISWDMAAFFWSVMAVLSCRHLDTTWTATSSSSVARTLLLFNAHLSLWVCLVAITLAFMSYVCFIFIPYGYWNAYDPTTYHGRRGYLTWLKKSWDWLWRLVHSFWRLGYPDNYFAQMGILIELVGLQALALVMVGPRFIGPRLVSLIRRFLWPTPAYRRRSPVATWTLAVGAITVPAAIILYLAFVLFLVLSFIAITTTWVLT